ncbi:MAG: carboxypeptidase regulatory-like domain-containing protein [Myxococcales bacterium]
MTQSRFTALAAVALLCACPGGGGTDPTPPQPDAGSNPKPARVTTSIIGTAVDDADGAPLAGVTVEAYGSKTTTDSNGTFVLEGLRVPADRCALSAKKAGYFATGKASVPVGGGVTRFRLRLVKKAAQSVASTGGSVSLAGGSGVEFQAGSFQQGGVAFAGTVQVAARHLDPTAADFGQQFPGDPAAVRTNGSDTMLVSYGVLQVEMEDAAGEKVELGTDLPATLTFPVPASMKGNAPSTIPLWYFDEDEAIWREEGTATLEGDRYVGQVVHFTAWNCDQPENTAWVSGSVSCGGQPVAEVSVEAGPSRGTTDAQGHFRIPVPANTPITVHVLEGSIHRSKVVRQAGPIAPDDTESVGDIPLDACPAHLKGRVVKEDGKPVSVRVRATWSGGGSDFQYASGGTLDVDAPPDTDVTITLTAETGEGVTLTKRTPASGGEDDLGTIIVAVAANCDFWDVDARPYKAALSPTGELLAVSVYNGSTIEIRDAASGTVRQTLPHGPGEGSFLEFSPDGKKLMSAALYGAAPKIWDVATGALLHEFDANVESSQWLPDSATIVATMWGKKLEQYSAADGSLVKTFAFKLSAPIQVIGLHGTEVLVLRTPSDYDVTAWDMTTDSEARSFHVGQASQMGSELFALAADGNVVAFEPYDHEDLGVFFWDTATGQKINAQAFFASVNDSTAEVMAFRPGHSAFVTQPEIRTGSSSHELPTMFSFPALTSQFTLPFPRYSRVDEYAFSADGRYLALATHNNTVRIIDVDSCH